MNEKELTHIDLFAGIGGFSLAGQWAGFKTICFVEIDPFCQEVLKQRFGAVVIPDIRNFDGTRFRGATLLTGGFPCQPFSHAGQRRGTADDRHLWPEMLRVIAESHPRWVVAENVRGLISIQDGVVFEQVCLDLENEGYEVQAFVIPACAVNAPHRRDRVWIIAHAIEPGTRGGFGAVGHEGRRSGQNGGEGIRQDNGAIGPSRVATANRDATQNPNRTRGRIGASQEQGRERDERDASTGDGERVHSETAPNSAQDTILSRNRGRRDGDSPRLRRTLQTAGSDSDASWDIPWPTVAQRLCALDDGLPPELAGRLLRNKNRVQRLKATGNAIVPQVAFQIIEKIAELEKNA